MSDALSDLTARVVEALRRSEDNPAGWTDEMFDRLGMRLEDVVATVLRVAVPAVKADTLRYAQAHVEGWSNGGTPAEVICRKIGRIADYFDKRSTLTDKAEGGST